MISTGHNAPLMGLVLAGGKSTRMGGNDKGAMLWHGKPQMYHLADLLVPFCNEVFISCKAERVREIEPPYKALPDLFTENGPINGILSALKTHPENGWLVVACDLPLISNATLGYLVANRRIELLATTYKSPHDGLPEPLITIWEPNSFEVLLASYEALKMCPRKVLLNNPVAILEPGHPDELMNVNTPEQAEIATKWMSANKNAI